MRLHRGVGSRSPSAILQRRHTATATQTAIPRLLALHQYCVLVHQRCRTRGHSVHRLLYGTRSCRCPACMAPFQMRCTQSGHPTPRIRALAHTSLNDLGGPFQIFQGHLQTCNPPGGHTDIICATILLAPEFHNSTFFHASSCKLKLKN